MIEERMTLAVGTTIRDPSGERYLIEGLLGTGGFGAVYLVRDRRVKDNLFALKEVIDPNKRDRERFVFEGELLKRLNHRALPCVYNVFEHDKRVYMLMDYVEGKNLEILRQEQPERRFPLSVALALMAPIVDALIYLHQQNPPIVHRDLKPANIIVPENAEEAMLVDFGLAKEYVADKTTSVIRHGSPGYAALEQYGSGTTPRTDIYGLGATFYTLLTGTVPIDAVSRATERKGFDPLTPASVVTPDVPTPIARTLRRAMSMSLDDRFSSIEEFWQELTVGFPILQTTSPRIPAFHATELMVPTRGAPTRQRVARTASSQNRQEVALWKRRGVLLPILSALLLIGVIGTTFLWYTLAYGSHPSTSQSKGITPTAQHSTVTAAVSPTARPTQKVSIYPIMASSYAGSIQDLMTHQKTDMYLTNFQLNQGNGNIQGDFQGLGIVGPFKGTVTRGGILQYKVIILQGTGIMSFDGLIKVGGDIHGSFKILDQSGTFGGEYGDYYLNFPRNG
jgi:serine/threonine protein kinase